MTVKYLQQKQEQGEELRKEIWAYISHLVRNIFAALFKIRHLGFNWSLAEQAWVTLKAFKLQIKICNQGFTDHEIVIKVLHQHLKSNVITKSQFDLHVLKHKDLKKRIQKIEQNKNKKNNWTKKDKQK